MDNICQRCQLLPAIDTTPKVIYLTFPIGFLRDKAKSLLKDIDFDYSEENELIVMRVPNFKDFLVRLHDNSNFSTSELNDIMCVALNDGESLSFLTFSRLKPLAFWFSLIESQEYFEILNEQRLTVHFQPVVESKSLRIIGYETLIRGVKKDGTLVSPKFLFDTAEKTDTLFYLDRFCRETAVKTSAVKKLLNYKIFINFIPTSIYDPVFCLQSTIQWAKHLEFEPSNLVFEVVESYKVSDIEHLSNVLNYYRNHGFLVALDDVGSGYSNLNVLVNLKPDIIKIDREIIRNIHNDELKQSVFKAIILLSKESNIQVLAEGVETVEEYNFVKEHVDLVQGYLFAKPNPEPIRQIQLQL